MSDMVMVMVALDRESLHYRVEVRPGEAREFVRHAESMNNRASTQSLLELLEEIDALIPGKYYPDVNGHPNSSNGKPNHLYAVGREYSRVLYLIVYKTYIDERMFSWEHFENALNILAQRHNADEHWITCNDKSSFEFRFWWD